MRKKHWEDRGSKIIAQWLRQVRVTLTDYNATTSERFKFSHIPSEGMMLLENIKKKDMGLEKGLPDFIVAIPSEISSNGKTTLLFCELKEPSDDTGKISTVQKAQKEWMEILSESADVHSKLCIGWESMMTFILDHMSIQAKVYLHKAGDIELITDRKWVRSLLNSLYSMDE